VLARKWPAALPVEMEATMSDVVGGIAVVEPLPDGLFRICLALHHKDGHVEPCSLLFHDQAVPIDLPAAQALAGEPIWCFRKDSPRHGWLDCQPSIRQRVSPGGPDRFHNTLNWQVQYVWLKYTACDARYNIWKELNQYGTDESGEPMPPVTAATFQNLRDHGYIY
jgi:hypothetical protein